MYSTALRSDLRIQDSCKGILVSTAIGYWYHHQPHGTRNLLVREITNLRSTVAIQVITVYPGTIEITHPDTP